MNKINTIIALVVALIFGIAGCVLIAAELVWIGSILFSLSFASTALFGYMAAHTWDD